MSNNKPKYNIGDFAFDCWSKKKGIIKNIIWAENTYCYEIDCHNGELSTSEEDIIQIPNLNVSQNEIDDLYQKQIIKTTNLAIRFQNESKDFRDKFCYYCQCIGCNLCQTVK